MARQTTERIIWAELQMAVSTCTLQVFAKVIEPIFSNTTTISLDDCNEMLSLSERFIEGGPLMCFYRFGNALAVL
jgi:hypothetical protein